ncbi:MAG TPA: hypothetical protein VF594_07395 [Rubricoccaceae bacterium]|jgi:hypothetical protein
MYLVQILLPLADNEERPFPAAHYDGVRDALTRRFGGLTAYSRAPAEGLWGPDAERAAEDDVVVYEVMVDELDRAWWASFRESLERLFAQDELVVRAHAVERL